MGPKRWRLDGQLALVTGGSAGIGRAIARELLGFGADVLLAARDAMLAHRLAKLYLQLRGGDGDTERRNELAQARKDFLQAVDAMEQSPLSQGQIRSNINLVRQQWDFFDNAISSSSVENKVLKVVVTTSERLCQSLTDIAGAYGQLAGGEQMLAQTTP